ncbi:ABC transporter ATP-binding protein [Peredibacter starrii]|uniref:ABC transporter ATP-binding protein n=1 Tax=Peredibacter starrii TaxID=28202 RepID=A0AAX4HL55_9BACT|nr:ABC transporter ATP-binding protein [Peredibacter starrii]WPU63951.1 ABC transporter ATP-binding protein [Peredibacter starrii]
MMKVSNLRKSYGEGSTKVEVLKGINLEIAKGETLALIGKSGSGKSTLLSLLAGLDQPDSGEIAVGDKKISHMKEKELTHFRAEHMGIVFQQFHLVSTLTALENVLLPLELLKRPDAKETAEKLLESVGLLHRAHHLPSQLSGGESQRVAIARALAIRPTILFADEPSGNLDEETGDKVMELLFKMVKETNTTLVLVTHDQDLARKCSRVVHLEHGSLA